MRRSLLTNVSYCVTGESASVSCCDINFRSLDLLGTTDICKKQQIHTVKERKANFLYLTKPPASWVREEYTPFPTRGFTWGLFVVMWLQGRKQAQAPFYLRQAILRWEASTTDCTKANSYLHLALYQKKGTICNQPHNTNKKERYSNFLPMHENSIWGKWTVVIWQKTCYVYHAVRYRFNPVFKERLFYCLNTE